MSHNWLIHILQIYKIDARIINSLQQLMKKWTTTLQVKVKNHRIMSGPIRTQRGIYQGVSLSPLWFCLALNPLSYLLNRTNYGFGIHFGNQEMKRLNHLLYLDDIKLHAATINYKNFYGSLTLFQETLKWYLGLKSAKHYVLQRGNLR